MILTPVLVLGGLIRLWNLAGTFGAENEDEGTYVAQAWAVLHGELAHYTYWYDHPPFGWIQLAAWFAATGALDRYDLSILAGRELVAVYAIGSAALIYVLCRRLGVNRGFSGLGAALSLVTPLALSWGRMAFLDNLAVPWLLGAMLVARSRRRSAGAALASGALLAGAVLTKETMIVFVPYVLWMIWQNSEPSYRVRNVVQAGVTLVTICLLYVLLALLKGEFLQGTGHVSLLNSAVWQVFGRASSGDIMQSGTPANDVLNNWFDRGDGILVGLAAVLFPLAAVRQASRPIAAAMLCAIALAIRGGYLPIPFIVAVIPLAALLVACGFDAIWSYMAPLERRAVTLLRRRTVALTLCVLALLAVPNWAVRDSRALSQDDTRPAADALSWIESNSPPSAGAQIIVDDAIWLDLIEAGYSRQHVDWYAKLDSDPAVMARYVPAGGAASSAWGRIDYLVIPKLDSRYVEIPSTLTSAIEHSTLVAHFGAWPEMNYLIYEVDH